MIGDHAHVRNAIPVLTLAKRRLVKRIRTNIENATVFSEPGGLFLEATPTTAPPPSAGCGLLEGNLRASSAVYIGSPAVPLFNEFCRVRNVIKDTKNFSTPNLDGVYNL